MSAIKKEVKPPLTELERKKAAWENARPTSDIYVREDYRGIPMHWDQFGKRDVYGWFVDYIQPPNEANKDDPGNLRARHWLDSREQFEAALQMNL